MCCMCVFMYVHGLLHWLQDLPLVMALSPLVTISPLLIRKFYLHCIIHLWTSNPTPNTQRHNRLVLIYTLSSPSSTFWLHKKALGDQQFWVTTIWRQNKRLNDKRAGKCSFSKYKCEYIWCVMNTLEKDRKKYTLQIHVVRLHTFARHAERKQNTSWKKT